MNHRGFQVRLSVKKRYDTARTPYQRVLESEQVTQASKDRLQAQYRTLNPVTFLRQIEQQQASVWKLAVGVMASETVQAAVQAVGSSS
jgi:hypothetical protein